MRRARRTFLSKRASAISAGKFTITNRMATSEMLSDQQLAQKSWRYRRKVLGIIKQAGAGHTGGSLSCLDILNVLYNRILNVSPQNFRDPNRDRYVQSKGHSVEALFVVLADKGFFDEKELDSLCTYQSHF